MTITRKFVGICSALIWCICFTVNGERHIIPEPDKELKEYIEQAAFDMNHDFNRTLLRRTTNASVYNESSVDRIFHDFYIEYDGKEISLFDLQMTADLSPQLTRSVPNMMYAYLDTALEWSTITVDGSYAFYDDPGSPDALAVTGKLRLIWTNAKAEGRIAFRPLDKEDSFLSTNYNLNFTADSFTMLFLGDAPSQKVNATIHTASKRINSRLQPDLFWKLQEDLRSLVDKILKSKSMAQMFGNNEEVSKKYRSFLQENQDLANKFTDELLSSLQKILIKTGYWRASIPNINKNFTKQIAFLTAWGNLSLFDGTAQNISSIKRTSNFSLITADNIELSGYLTFEDLSAYYKHYKAKVWNFRPTGEVVARASKNSLYVKLLVKKDEKSAIGLKLLGYDLKVRVDHIDVQATGISFLLNWLLSLISTSITNNFKVEISRSIEKNLRDIMNTILRSKL
ncbi:unnamed protein product [Hermetia illucens]|uniref:Uncharacterized protein n=1 Tax=Hermetia illucens TaxID=343691 RepID=A0A7R8UZD5_HERIL|nr:uncharacterized protein LOC119657554 [Hermetia illucens]CAD7089728.1 unnamed protein product [Hermetia illucens]